MAIQTDSAYWANRYEDIANNAFKIGDAATPELNQMFSETFKQINDDISSFYHKYGVIDTTPKFETLASGARVVSGTAKDLTVPITEAAKGNRLLNLEKQLTENLRTLGSKENYLMTNTLSTAANDVYYQSLYEIAKGTSVATTFDLLTVSQVKAIIENPVHGANFSTRIWKNTGKLASTVNETMKAGLTQGLSLGEMAKRVGESKNGGLYDAKRLLRTETTNVLNQAAMESYKASGILTHYEFLATLDDRTTEDCAFLDGTRIRLEDGITGINLPPMHVMCRSTTVPSFSKDDYKNITRIAKDAEGTGILVDGQMTYQMFMQKFLPNRPPLQPTAIAPTITVPTEGMSRAEAIDYWNKQISDAVGHDNRLKLVDDAAKDLLARDGAVTAGDRVPIQVIRESQEKLALKTPARVQRIDLKKYPDMPEKLKTQMIGKLDDLEAHVIAGKENAAQGAIDKLSDLTRMYEGSYNSGVAVRREIDFMKQFVNESMDDIAKIRKGQLTQQYTVKLPWSDDGVRVTIQRAGGGSFRGANVEAVEDIADWLETYVSKASWDKPYFKVNGEFGASRAYAMNSSNYIMIDTRNRVSTGIHEIGHILHHNSDKATHTIDAWFQSRIQGDKLTRIYVGKKEFGYRDKFIDHYIGKEYGYAAGNSGTEVLSMGLEMMHDDPTMFYNKDANMFRLIYSLMHGVGIP